MRWRLRRLAGSPDGAAGDLSGSFDEARFNTPLDLVLSADENSLFVADVGNFGLRQVQLDNDYVGTVTPLQDWPRWDAPGTLSGYPRNLAIFKSASDDEYLRIIGDNAINGDPNVLFEWSLWTGNQGSALSTAGSLGAIAHDPDGTTATVKIHVGEPGTGWGTLALTGANRGQITEPPVIPDPPFCDPPTNSIPITVAQVRDFDTAQNSGVARVGPVIVAFRWQSTGTGTSVVAFDPWNETAFPSPYTTCDAPTEPTSIEVECTDAIATPFPPWSATRGPDDPLTGLPTVIGAAWRSPNGILLRVVLDADNASLQVAYDLIPGFPDIPVTAVAYSPKRETYYFTSAALWGSPGIEMPANAILALEWAPDPSVYVGGSGRLPIQRVTAP